MKKKTIRLAAGVVTILLAAASLPAAADGGMNTERAMAGMSVALNNYNASSISGNGIAGILDDVKAAKSAASETEEQTEPQTQAAEETEAVPEETVQTVSPYANVAIAQVANDDGYVNVRTDSSTEAEIVGKIYNNCAATILETVDGENGEWYRIQSGTVEGYIKAEFFITGEEAEKIAKEIGTVYATVTSPTLKVREQPDLSEDVRILTLLPLEGRYIVTEETDEWAFIQVDADTSGYVYKECVSIDVEFKKAISLEEEAAKKAEEEQRQRDYEAAQQAYLNQQAQQSQVATQVPTQGASQTPAATQAPAETQAPTQGASAGSSELRNALCAFAQQFVGNPYVWGGTSLTNGADCSGFVLSVFAQYGYSLPHSSAAQANCGTRIGLDQVQPGDLVFYSNNGSTIGHVGIYIGNGQIVHAVSEAYGIQVWSMYYKTPCAAVRILP